MLEGLKSRLCSLDWPSLRRLWHRQLRGGPSSSKSSKTCTKNLASKSSGANRHTPHQPRMLPMRAHRTEQQKRSPVPLRGLRTPSPRRLKRPGHDRGAASAARIQRLAKTREGFSWKSRGELRWRKKEEHSRLLSLGIRFPRLWAALAARPKKQNNETNKPASSSAAGAPSGAQEDDCGGPRLDRKRNAHYRHPCLTGKELKTISMS